MKKLFRFALGVFLIVLTAIIWVTSGYLIQLIFLSQSFNKPFFYTYFSTSLFTCYLLLGLCVPSWQRSFLHLFRDVFIKKRILTNIPINSDEEESEVEMNQKSEEVEKSKSMVSIERVVSTGIIIAPLWFLANYLYNIGLNYTSLSSSTIISSGSPMFGFIFSTLFRIERFSIVRLFCVITTFGGVILITLVDYWFPTTSSESSSGENPLLGNVLSIISSMLYGLYTTVLQKRVGEGKKEKEFSITMMFGVVGLTNLLGLFSVLILLSVVRFEVLEVPGWRTVLTLIGNGFIGTVFSDLIWAFSVVLTSSVCALIGLSLSIPLSLVVDLMDGNRKLDGVLKAILYLTGTLLVCSAFVTANVSYFFPKKIKYYDEGIFFVKWMKRLIYGKKEMKKSDGEEEFEEEFEELVEEISDESSETSNTSDNKNLETIDQENNVL